MVNINGIFPGLVRAVRSVAIALAFSRQMKTAFDALIRRLGDNTWKAPHD